MVGVGDGRAEGGAVGCWPCAPTPAKLLDPPVLLAESQRHVTGFRRRWWTLKLERIVKTAWMNITNLQQPFIMMSIH